MIKLRLDDYSPFINKRKWEEIFEIIEPIRKRCIIAAIPDHYESFEKIRTHFEYINFIEGLVHLNKQGFEIAQHGYSHDYPYLNDKNTFIGSKRLTTEFCNVSFEEQEKRILKGLNFFKKLDINIKGFVSPGHSFDMNTIKICESNSFSWFGDSFQFKKNKIDYFKKMQLISSNYGLDKFAIKNYIQSFKNQFNYQIVIHPNNIQKKELIRLIKIKEIFRNESK